MNSALRGEKPVTIPAGDVTLEGRFLPGATGGAVIAHPHPLFGGSLDNNVVWTAVKAFQVRNWATLRFNFRGVGRSTGSYAEGQGEVEDVGAAFRFLQARTPGPCFLVGYSFGAWVAARALLTGLKATGALLIAPPLVVMALDFLPQVPRLALVVVGDRDELCPLAALRTLLKKSAAPPDLQVIAGADHFWAGQEAQLFRVLRDFPLPGV